MLDVSRTPVGRFGSALMGESPVSRAEALTHGVDFSGTAMLETVDKARDLHGDNPLAWMEEYAASGEPHLRVGPGVRCDRRVRAAPPGLVSARGLARTPEAGGYWRSLAIRTVVRASPLGVRRPTEAPAESHEMRQEDVEGRVVPIVRRLIHSHGALIAGPRRG